MISDGKKEGRRGVSSVAERTGQYMELALENMNELPSKAQFE
jgi:hypothetical protein